MLRTLVLCVLFAGLACPAAADEPPAPTEKPAAPAKPDKPAVKQNERVWSGFVWKDDQGRIRMGWPVIAMGVMAQPAHVIDKPLADKLTPLLSGLDTDWLFLNYVLEDPAEKALPKLPRILVRIRGQVQEADTGRRFFDSSKPTVLLEPKLLGVEFLDAGWLKAWGTVYREPFSPFRIRDEDRTKVAASVPTLAPKVVEAVLAMRRRPLATVEQRALVKKVDPQAKVDDGFRKAQEYDLIRWLRRVNEERKLSLKNLDALGEVPPTGIEIQRAFLATETLPAFLKKIRSMWKGSLEQLVLPHYRKQDGGTSWVEVDVETVATRWTDEQYVAYRALAKQMLGS